MVLIFLISECLFLVIGFVGKSRVGSDIYRIVVGVFFLCYGVFVYVGRLKVCVCKGRILRKCIYSNVWRS